MTSDGREDGPPWASLFAQHRAQSGLSMDALASACDVAKNTVFKWEHGKAVPGEDVWPAIHKALPALPPPPGIGKPKATYDELLADNARLRELAMVDELTELPNRRATLAALDKALRSAHRGGETLGIAHLDLDHFKRFNDEDTSHKTGDEVLKAFAAAVAGCLRDDDFVGRLGGEEFVAIFDKANAQQARMLAERIRGRVEQNKVKGHRVTVSIGVSVYTAPDLSKDENRVLSKEQCTELRKQLLDQADAATYWAKDDGRNTVVLYSAEEKTRREVAAAERRAREAEAAARKAREDAQIKSSAATPAAPTPMRRRRGLPVPLQLLVASILLLLTTTSFFSSEGTGCKPTPTPPAVPDCVVRGDCIDH